jgi:hypothetical protein
MPSSTHPPTHPCTRRFPHEAEGIRKFYGECWAVFNALNSLEMKSLEEPRYLLGEFVKDPLSCLTLASYLITNTGGWVGAQQAWLGGEGRAVICD